MDDAVKNAIRVERTMGFDDGQRVQAVQIGGREDLRRELLLDKLVGRMEVLELRLSEQKPVGVQRPRISATYVTGKGTPNATALFKETMTTVERVNRLRRYVTVIARL